MLSYNRTGVGTLMFSNTVIGSSELSDQATSSSWRSQSTRLWPLRRWMTSSSPAPACSRRVWPSGKCWQATRLLLWLRKGGIFVEHAPRSALLDLRGKLARVPASVYGAYDCSVCYDRCEASPEWPVASGTARPSNQQSNLYQCPLVVCIVLSCSRWFRGSLWHRTSVTWPIKFVNVRLMFLASGQMSYWYAIKAVIVRSYLRLPGHRVCVCVCVCVCVFVCLRS